MYTSTFELKELENTIKHTIKHKYIYKHINEPVIDRDKLLFLSEIYQKTSMSYNQKKDYITIVMLIEIALNTHDLVEEKETENYEEATKKQLKVLAGDYYSGMYYYLLAKLEDVQMIRKLASIIKVVNEEKMKLYYSDYATELEFYDSLFIVETKLFTQIAQINNESHETISHVSKILLINRLKKDREDTHSYTYKYYKKNNIKNELILISITKKIMQLENDLNNNCDKITSNHFSLLS